MLSEFEESVTLSAIEFLEVEDVLVKGGCLVHVIHLDHDMVAAVDPDAHELVFCCAREAPRSAATSALPTKASVSGDAGADSNSATPNPAPWIAWINCAFVTRTGSYRTAASPLVMLTH